MEYCIHMKIRFSTIKYVIPALFTTYALNYPAPAIAQNFKNANKIIDTFEHAGSKSVNPVDKYTQDDLPRAFREEINPSSWTNDPDILKKAPNPMFTLQGEKVRAKGVIDITNCRLYIYNEFGKAIESFRVAAGAPKTPTKPGIRKILGKQVYPYKNCPKNSKRYRFPRDYGPKIAYLNVVDTITGVLHDNGGYFHGTRRESAVSKANRHLTHGCVRVHNRDALYLISDVFKIGDYLKYVK